jgi:site-specific recombinase XerD
MLERVFRDPVVLSDLKTGRFSKPLDDLIDFLTEQRYSLSSIQEYLAIAGHFAYWEQTNTPTGSALTAMSVDRFLNEHLGRCHCRVPRWTRSEKARLGRFMAILRVHGLVSEVEVQFAATSVDLMIDEYTAYLRDARGATPGTCREYSFLVREFLETVYGTNSVDLPSLTPTRVIDFVSGRTKRIRSNSKGVTSALRSFLRFAEMKGLCEHSIIDAVPTVPRWKLTRLPKSLTIEQANQLLDCFDQSTAVGRRDYAITLCMLRLGLRAGEVAGLALEDIDWPQATVQIQSTKMRRASSLPLPEDLGRAIASYLQYGRPRIKSRRIFVHHIAPLGASFTASAVRAVVGRAFQRAGLQVPSRGSHVLRHTAATLMVQHGASIKEVADVLRHRTIDTTVIYTKVDLPTLSSVALPWPEEVQP